MRSTSGVCRVVLVACGVFLAFLACDCTASNSDSDNIDVDSSEFSFRSLIPSSTSLDERVQPEKRTARAQYCGSRLADALHLVCEGKYYVPKKKSYNELEGGSPYWFIPLLDEDRPRSLAAALMPEPLRRQARGASDDCCKKPCSRKEMSRYCL